jgi:hypothetical protein
MNKGIFLVKLILVNSGRNPVKSNFHANFQNRFQLILPLNGVQNIGSLAAQVCIKRSRWCHHLQR